MGVRGERRSTEMIGDLLQLNMTRPASAGLLSRVVIGRFPRKADIIEKIVLRRVPVVKSLRHVL